MAEKTKISYCDATVNAWWSCSRVHVGCTSCYAEQLAGRFGIPWGPSTPRRYMSGWRKVLARVARRAEREGRSLKVFLNDMSDLFDDHEGDVVDAKKQRLWIRGSQIEPESGDFTENSLRDNRFEPLRISHLRQQVFAEVDRYADRLTFLMLTKRPQNIRRMWPLTPCADCGAAGVDGRPCPTCRECRRDIARNGAGGDYVYRHNCWLLYSASDQQSLDAGLPHLLECCGLAPVLGLSLEPLIGPVDLDACWPGGLARGDGPYVRGIDFCIVGGESGPRHRPMEIAWVESIAKQCGAAGVPLYVKQDCGLKPGQQGRIPDDIWSMKEFPRCENAKPPR